MKEKNGLVLGGGGARGAYQAGAIKALNELGLQFDIVTGASVGSLNGLIYTLGDFAFIDEIWNNMSFEKIFDESFGLDNNTIKFVSKTIKSKSIEPTNLNKLIEDFINRKKNEIKNVEKKFAFTYARAFPLKGFEINLEDLPIEQIKHYINASCACFPVFRPEKIGNSYYIDGGYKDVLPIRLAEKLGANNIVVIDLKCPGLRRRKKFKNTSVIIIKSKKKLGSYFDFSNKRARKNIKYGYNDVMKKMGYLFGNYYYFKKDQQIENLYLHKKFRKVLKKLENIMTSLDFDDSHIYSFKNTFVEVKNKIRNLEGKQRYLLFYKYSTLINYLEKKINLKF